MLPRMASVSGSRIVVPVLPASTDFMTAHLLILRLTTSMLTLRRRRRPARRGEASKYQHQDFVVAHSQR